MDSKDWRTSLKAFLDSNPDLPQGEEPAQEAVPSKPAMRLDILLDRKGRSGKTATLVTGFALDDKEVAKLASSKKSSLGTVGSSRGGEILIQGDRRKDVLEFLLTRGYKARII